MGTASSSHHHLQRPGKTAIGIKLQVAGKPANPAAVERPSMDYTHFISLPLAIHPELIDKLSSFQNTILGYTTLSYAERQAVDKKNKELGIDRSIFVNPKTFHLTVLMLKLWNKDRVAEATQVLQSTSQKVMEALKNRPIFIRLKGLDLMRGSPAEAHVLYAPVEEIGGEGRLLHACQVIIDAYMKAGLVLEKDAKQTLKLHATIMNAKFRKSKEKIRESFDARGIFKQYGSEDWGDYIIRNAHLSQRSANDQNGYYHCCASIPFPEARGGQGVRELERPVSAPSRNTRPEPGRSANVNDFPGFGQNRGTGRGGGRCHGRTGNMNDFQGRGNGHDRAVNIIEFQGRGRGRGRGGGRGRGRGHGRTGNINDFHGRSG